MLQLLGDQLIGSNRLAVFELVKNSYDADASKVWLTFHDIATSDARISVRDNGEGMDLDTITNVWLEPGADYREAQRREMKRSEKYHRLPLGEKGVGRFAVHKLGSHIELRTRKKGGPEHKVVIDWEAFSKHRYMDEAIVQIEASEPPVFKAGSSGTQIEISGLKSSWRRPDIRKLWLNVKSISSPTKAPDSFEVVLAVPGHKSWLDGLLDTPEFLGRAMWHFVFLYDHGRYEWTYRFRPLPGIKLKGYEAKSPKGAELKLPSDYQRMFSFTDEAGKVVKRIVADEGFTQVETKSGSVEQIGPVMGEFYVFDRDKPVLSIMPEANSLTDFLDESGGVRVYRDGVRVYNYGERAAGDDWLGLDQRRVNIPARRISNNLIIGIVDLSLSDSCDPVHGLIEKTNREGFVEGDALDKFKAIVLGALVELENLRRQDKENVRIALGTLTEKSIADIESPINALHAELVKRKLDSVLGNHLKAIQRKFDEMKEVMTHSGMAGLNLGILFHEIDRGVKGLTTDIRSHAPMDRLLGRAEHLSQLLDGFSTLLRKDKKKRHNIKNILKEAKLLNENRFSAHDIVFSCPVLADEQPEFQVEVSLGMVLGALANLIDNAIYWLQVRWPSKVGARKKRAIYIGVTDFYDEGPALVIADNGTGLPPDVSSLTKPFITMKPDGMGLGLYYVNLVCELNGARLVVSPDREDVGIPAAYDGAAFAIIFGKEDK